MSWFTSFLLVVYYFFSFLVCIIPVFSNNWSVSILNLLYSDFFSTLSCTFNNNSFIFFSMLLICGSLSLNYSLHYLGSNGYGSNLLFFNMFVFLVTMIFLTLTSNLLTSLVFWEYLGIVSFLLILFYQNEVGLRAALVTLITSRVGDIFLFLLTGYFIYFSNVLNLGIFMLLIVFVCVVGSKSAFFPMVSWLLEAMRAPTPVSALVHSSTLVAAGVWFTSEYLFLFYNPAINIVVVSCCFLTIFVTFFCSLCISDVKKIVALSTSNNISWCLLYILSGEMGLGLIQLLSHGVGKCIFFTLMGDIMSSEEGGQNYKSYYNKTNPLFVGGLIVSLVFLAGLPFIGIYFSKHFFFSSILCNSSNLVFILFSYICLAGTNAYSVRLLMMSLGAISGSRVNFESLFLLGVLTLPVGLIFNSSLVANEGEIFEGGALGSAMILFFVFVGGLLGYASYLTSGGLMSSNLYFSSIGVMDWLVEYSIIIFCYFLSSSNVSLYRWDSSLYKLIISNFQVSMLAIMGVSVLGVSIIFL
nr:NADH dehydrogenase subunit 5 [Neoheterobothrium hirame]